MNKTPACCRSATVVAFVFASTMSAIHAQEPASPENLAGQSAAVMESVTVMPGFIKRFDLQKELQTIHVGDPSVADVVPLTTKSILIQGKKIGRTGIDILGANAKEVITFDVKVDPLPGSKTMQLYNSKVLENSVSYECIEKSGCGYPEVHSVKPEDLPKGYTLNTNNNNNKNIGGNNQ
jgi:Flp pilus assembly secretin CpaC